jgi:hypothetical protein
VDVAEAVSGHPCREDELAQAMLIRGQQLNGDGPTMMAICEGCGSELREGASRFCGEACRSLFTEKLRRGTVAHPGRRAARRRRRRGR